MSAPSGSIRGVGELTVDDRARLQLGLVTRAQALAGGLTRRQIDARLKSKEWISVLPGVYCLASAPRTAEQQIHAHCLALGPHAYASHLTAAWLWGLSGCAEPVEVHVTAPRDRRTRDKAVTLHSHRGALEEGFTFRRGVPTTLLSRTLLDLAPLLPPDRLEVVLDSGWRIHRDLFVELDEFISTLKPRGRAGIARLADLVMIRRGTVPTDSDFETQVLQRVRGAGLVTPVLQFQIYDATGVIPLARGDLVWPDLKVVLMPDGLSFHKTKHQFEKDAAVRARLTAMGWRYVSVPRGSLDDPAWLSAISHMVPKAQMALFRSSPRRVPVVEAVVRRSPTVRPSQLEIPVPDPSQP